MKKLLEQFRNLNPRDPGAWPPLPKAMLLVGVLVGIIALGYFLDWQEQMDSLDAGRLQEAKLKDEYVLKQQQAIQISISTASSCAKSTALSGSFEAASESIANDALPRGHQPGGARSRVCNLTCSSRRRRRPSVNSTPSCRSR